MTVDAQRHHEVAALGERAGVQLLDAQHVAPALERVAAERRIGRDADGGLEDRRPGRERVERRREVGREIVRPDRPGRVEPEPGPGPEVDRIEGHAAPGPEVGGAAEPARDGGVRLEMVVGPQALGDREVVGGGLGPLAAALEHQNPEAAVGERERGDDADGARADDVDVRGELPERGEAGPSSRIMRSGRLRCGVRDPASAPRSRARSRKAHSAASRLPVRSARSW